MYVLQALRVDHDTLRGVVAKSQVSEEQEISIAMASVDSIRGVEGTNEPNVGLNLWYLWMGGLVLLFILGRGA